MDWHSTANELSVAGSLTIDRIRKCTTANLSSQHGHSEQRSLATVFDIASSDHDSASQRGEYIS